MQKFMTIIIQLLKVMCGVLQQRHMTFCDVGRRVSNMSKEVQGIGKHFCKIIFYLDNHLIPIRLIQNVICVPFKLNAISF